MKISDESKILDESFRKMVIEEIDGPENLARKDEMLRRLDVFKDYIKYYMTQILEDELEAETIDEMLSRTSVINLLKKIIGKKARVYKTGAERRFSGKEETQDQMDEIYDFLNMNVNMKKLNRFLELAKNTLGHVAPIEEDGELFSYALRPKFPHLYDVIEDSRDPERPLAYIFSPHTRRQETHDLRIEEGRGVGAQKTNFRSGDGKDQTIADAPADEGENDTREFVWWSKSYHFTTDSKGAILEDKSPDDLYNPIGMLPAVSLHKDQDGSYWATGGEDLIEGTLLVNVLITDMNFIAKLNGFGMFYFFGKNPPKSIKLGPNRGIIHNVEPDDPTPDAGFITSSPPLGELRQNIEQAIALLLTTNDLSTSQVSGTLDGGNAASGIADLISRSEVTSAVEDDQAIFADAERGIFKRIRAWHNLYHDKRKLIPELQELGKIDDNATLSIQFPPAQEFQSEESRVNTIVRKLENKLITKVRAIKQANPGFTNDEAIEELKAMTLEDLQKQRAMMENQISEMTEEDNGEDTEQSNEEG